jgi:hypothetical protein
VGPVFFCGVKRDEKKVATDRSFLVSDPQRWGSSVGQKVEVVLFCRGNLYGQLQPQRGCVVRVLGEA